MRPLSARPLAVPLATVLTLSSFLALRPSYAAKQLPPPVETPAAGARMPALSPDGKRLAFVWRGDVWVSGATGGHATPITSSVELDAYPLWSPDGRWIAFSSLRNGNWDIFVVPAEGGEAKQMTFSGASEVASDWSPDGKYLIYSGQGDLPSDSALFSLDVSSLRFRKITEDYKGLAGATFSPDGKRLVVQRSGFPWTRPRYHGSAAAQLWTLDLATGKRISVADDESQHLWPHFLPGGREVIAVGVGEQTPNAEWLNKPLPPLQDSAARTPNVWIYPADGKGKPRQVTRMVGGSVRYPTVARQTGDLVFEHEHDLYRLPVGAKEPQKLTLYCAGDSKLSDVQRQTFTNSDVTESEVSPDGKTFGFVLRDDLWITPVEKDKKDRNADLAVRLTNFPGSERDFNWSKDNKQLFFVSDRDGNDRVFALDVASKAVRPLWTGKEDVNNPSVTPDGTKVAFWVRGKDEGGLYVKPTAPEQASVPAKRILAVPGAAQGGYSFSPDNKWVAFTRRGLESGGYNIYIAPADGTGTPINVTRLNAGHGQPTWSPDGRYLFFTSNRDGNGLYVLPLKPEDARVDELEIKYEKPTAPVMVAIDFDETAPRVRKVLGQDIDDLTITDDGSVFFLTGGDAFQSSFDGKDVKKLTNGGGLSALRAARDGKTLFFARGGGLYSLKVPDPAHAQTPVAFTAQWERNIRDEREAAFSQFWRGYNRNFYDANFHGRDWAAIRKRYEALLPSVGTRDEFATLLNMMVGELEASHSEVGAAASPVVSPVTRQLGLYFDYSYVGPGIRIRDVPKRAPGWYAKTRLKPGDYLVAIDDKNVTLDENLYKSLNDKGDRDFVLLVNDKPTRVGAHTVRYRALSGGEWSDIHYRNRVENLRKRVEEMSHGTIGYVHIAGMGGPNQVTFDRELYEYAEGKKAVIIDVRFNGGGNIADTLVNWLGTKPYGNYVPRDGYPEPAPSRGWNKPVVVLMNEHSFSNAEMFPDSMRAAGIATLVGMPTPGYVIWTGDFTLVDGTHARMPGSGVYRKDGSPMEDRGEQPDIRVPLSNEDWMAGRDPQLDKAVEKLMK